jgi:hypothetical protein
MATDIKAVVEVLDECASRVENSKDVRPATRKQVWKLASLIVERGEDVSQFRGTACPLRTPRKQSRRD